MTKQIETIEYPLSYKRVLTREVPIGDLKIGGQNPILLQSMLTSSTQNIESCLSEIKSLTAVGCQLIRLTIPSRKDLDCVPEIRRLMKNEGISAALVADIHFSPALAIDACELFEKIRINPGNYSDKPKASKSAETRIPFEEGQEILKEAIKPLADKLIKTGRALRVGVNQGSLSSRVMERFGDSPEGMVYSALEMVEIFESLGVKKIVVSLKSSNPIVVQKAYRLMALRQKGKEAIPVHLGVTEAGNGLMGRVKSLAGIGPLLLDGIGDTVRVSLTEPSANEILFARDYIPKLFEGLVENNDNHSENMIWSRPLNENRMLNTTVGVGEEILGSGSPLKIGTEEGKELPKTDVELESDFLYSLNSGGLSVGNRQIALISGEPETDQNKDSKLVCFKEGTTLYQAREYYKKLNKTQSSPVGYFISQDLEFKDATHIAGMLSEGLLDYLIVSGTITSEALTVLICLLQATRTKILTTDYIICPSCGRTLFDIQATAEKIKEKTNHLKGLKIGIMGCIVNGPGEMADADFGYVGSGSGKVDLYFGQQQVKRGIDESEAVERLIDLIKERGFWKEAR